MTCSWCLGSGWYWVRHDEIDTGQMVYCQCEHGERLEIRNIEKAMCTGFDPQHHEALLVATREMPCE